VRAGRDTTHASHHGALPRRTRARRTALVGAAILVLVSHVTATAASRYDPALRFRSLTTPHFVIHYHQGEEARALGLARTAEDIHAALVPRVGPAPSERTRVVLVDQDDEPNGWATPIPYPLIEVRLVPPEGSSFLGNTDDWLRLVLTHEYTHVLHLGQSRGWAAIPRVLFGRTPIAYPNLTLPLWHIEGLATWEESRGGAGRVHAGDFRAVVTAAARSGRAEPLDRVNGGLVAWPGGTGWYAYGALFHQYLADRFGEERLHELSRRTAGRAPYLTSGAFKSVYGQSLGSLWSAFERDRAHRAQGGPAGPVRQVTHEGYVIAGPRFDVDGAMLYSHQGPHDFPALMRVGAETRRASRLTTRYGGERIGVSPDALYFDQLGARANVSLTSDLYRWDRATGDTRRLTCGARLADPDVSPDGRVLAAVQVHDGGRRLVLLDRAGLDRGACGGTGRSLEPLAAIGGPRDVYAGPRFSPDGRWIAAERRIQDGPSAVVVIEVDSREVVGAIAGDRGRNVTPAWTPDSGSIVFASDRDGGPFGLYRAWLTPDARGVERIARLPGPPGGAHSPDVSADGRRVLSVGYTVDGFDVFEIDLDRGTGLTESLTGRGFGAAAVAERPAGRDVSRAADVTEGSVRSDFSSAGVGSLEHPVGAPSHDAGPAPTPYRPWSTLWPRAWLPVLETADDQTRLGATTGAADALGYHAWGLTATWAVAVQPSIDAVVPRSRPDVNAIYVYDRWRPSLYTQYSDETTPLLIARLTPAERPAALRERSIELGASLPFRRVRWTQTALVAWHREHAALDGPLDRDRSDRGALRAGWALQTARRYGYSIGPENGVAIGITTEAGWRALGADAAAGLTRFDARAYVGIWPRHATIAMRASGAASRGHGGAARLLRLGGTDGDTAVLSFDTDATSLLRGFPYGTFRGTRAALANIEYRFPIWYVERGIGTWPVFVRSVHAAGFFDVGHAWTGAFRTDDLKRSWGGELSTDVVLGYALPLTFTAGVAWGHDGAGVVGDNQQAYTRVGLAF
jgi:hypothetical protein